MRLLSGLTQVDPVGYPPDQFGLPGTGARGAPNRMNMRLMAAIWIAALYGALGGCNGHGERAGQEVREDVRGVRDFLRDRGITIDTRLPER